MSLNFKLQSAACSTEESMCLRWFCLSWTEKQIKTHVLVSDSWNGFRDRHSSILVDISQQGNSLFAFQRLFPQSRSQYSKQHNSVQGNIFKIYHIPYFPIIQGMQNRWNIDNRCHFAPENKTWRTGVVEQESNKALHKSQKGQSKLVPWCLKGGRGNKTHGHPLILSK